MVGRNSLFAEAHSLDSSHRNMVDDSHDQTFSISGEKDDRSADMLEFIKKEEDLIWWYGEMSLI